MVQASFDRRACCFDGIGTVPTLMYALVVSEWLALAQPFDAHWCHMGTALKHPVPDRDRVKPSFVMFDIRAL